MGWWKTAKPGDFVVAVRTTKPIHGTDWLVSPPVGLVAGKVYEIADIFYAGEGWSYQSVAIRVAGQSNGLYADGNEGAWDVTIFRPVKPLHTSLTDCLNAPVFPWGVRKDEHV